MGSVERNFIMYSEDMIQSMERIGEYADGLDLQEFKQNHLVIDAVVRNFEIIGEASKNVPKDIREKYPEIPWRQMYGLRNLIAHEYFGVDYEMIWEIATKNIPQNYKDLLNIVDAEKMNNKNI